MISAGAKVLGSFTIGENSKIGAGSVVTKDIPDWVVAAGNPCRVIREITEEDFEYYYKDRSLMRRLWKKSAAIGRRQKPAVTMRNSGGLFFYGGISDLLLDI